MSKEICISSTPHETRLAILEDDQLTEVYYERENEYTLAGSIYKGRVTRVLPGYAVGIRRLGPGARRFSLRHGFHGGAGRLFRLRANSGERPATRRGDAGQGEPPAACRIRGKKRLHGATAPRQVREGQHPGQAPAGEFEDGTRRWRGRRGRRKGFRPQQGSQQAAPAHDQTVQTGPGRSRDITPQRIPRRANGTSGSRPASRQLRSLFPVSRFRSTAVRALRPAKPVDARCTAAAGRCHRCQALHADRDPTCMGRRRSASRRIHFPLSGCP